MTQPHHSPVLRTTTLTAVFLALLLPALVWVPPTAQAAYQWELIHEGQILDSNGVTESVREANFGGMIRQGTNSYLTAVLSQTDSGSGDFDNPGVAKCAIDQCGAQQSLSGTGGQTTNNFKLHNRTDQHAYGCAAFGAAGLRFYQSTNGGAIWSTVVLTATTAEYCDVATHDGSHFALVWGNATTDDWVVSVSTDSGATFPNQYLVSAGAPNIQDFTQAVVLAWSDTSYTAYVSYDDGLTDRCDTTTLSAWTCQADQFTANTLNWDRFGDTYHLVYGTSGTDFAGYAIQSSAGAVLATVDAWNVGDAATDVCAADLAVYSPTRVAITFVLCDDTEGTFKLAESKDGGATWAAETVASLATNEPVGVDDFWTGVAYSPEGRIVAGFYAKVDDDVCGTPDASTAADRCFFVYVSGEQFVAIGAAATSDAFTDLVGFSADPTRGFIIIRTDDGTNVRTLDGVNLDTVSSTDTDCLNFFPDGVFATTIQFAAFTTCDGTGDADQASHLSVRVWNDLSTLASSDTQCDFSDTDIFLNGFTDEGGDDARQINQIESFPIDYTQFHESQNTNTICAVAWGWASVTGNVGVNVYNAVLATASDIRKWDQDAYSGSTPNDMCTAADGDQMWIGAVQSGTTTRTWDVDFDKFTSGGAAYWFPTLQDPPAVYSGSATGASGIDCVDDKFAFSKQTVVGMFTKGGASPLWTKSITQGEDRGITLSSEIGVCGRNVAWADDGSWTLAYASNGTVRATGSMPTGDFVGMQISAGSQDLYVATDLGVTRYDISVATGECSDTPGGTIDDGDGGGTNGPGLPPIFGDNPTPIPGVGAFGNQLFFGAIIVGGCAVGLFFLLHSVTGAIIGSILGTVLSWGLGLFSGGVVFVIVTLGGLAAFLVFRGS